MCVCGVRSVWCGVRVVWCMRSVVCDPSGAPAPGRARDPKRTPKHSDLRGRRQKSDNEGIRTPAGRSQWISGPSLLGHVVPCNFTRFINYTFLFFFACVARGVFSDDLGISCRHARPFAWEPPGDVPRSLGHILGQLGAILSTHLRHTLSQHPPK